MVNFNNFGVAKEADMHRQFQVEVTEKFGIEAYYLKKTTENIEKIFGEDDTMRYNHAVKIMILPQNAEDYEAGGDQFFQFGMTITDQLIVDIEQKTFQTATGLTQPREHDLVYIPLFGIWFQINFKNDDTMWYVNGQLFLFELKLEMWQYSHEEISTGVAAVDTEAPSDSNTVESDNDVIDDYEEAHNLIDDFDDLFE